MGNLQSAANIAVSTPQKFGLYDCFSRDEAPKYEDFDPFGMEKPHSRFSSSSQSLSTPVQAAAADSPEEDPAENALRKWLLDEAHLSTRILDDTIQRLKAADVYDVQDLQVLRRVGFTDVLSDVTAMKITDALELRDAQINNVTSPIPNQHTGFSSACMSPSAYPPSPCPPKWNGDLLVTYTMPKEGALDGAEELDVMDIES